MSYHYEIIMQYYREGTIEDAVNYFEQYKELFSQEEVEKIESILPNRSEQFYEVVEKNPRALFHLHNEVKKHRKWNDDNFCDNLGINREELKRIITLVPTSKKTRDKILIEWIKCRTEKTEI